MSYTPDRLWCWRDPIAGYVGQTSHARNGASEYIRADLYEALKAENERLRDALIDAADMLSGATFEVMRMRGQYIDREDVVCRARAALSATKPAAEPLDMTRPGDVKHDT